MEKILAQMNPWWRSPYSSPGIPRQKILDGLLALESNKDIIIIKGLRRVGKTTLMLQLIDMMIKRGADPHRILYASMDNLALNESSIHEIVDGYRSIHKLPYDVFVTLFLDEIHTAENWELELKNLYDMGFCKVYASGSQSLDITMRTPNLTGRHRFVDVYPLDFTEYVSFRGGSLRSEDQHLGPAYIDEYLQDGGIPEYVLGRDINYLNSAIESILFRELIEKANIRNRDNLLDILRMIARNAGSPLSMRRISRTLRISTVTVSTVVSLLREANIIRSVERAGKFGERRTAPLKVYLADNGLFNILAEKINIGILAENAVANHLMRIGKPYYTSMGGKEVDFIMGDDAYEVKYKQEITERDTIGLKRLDVKGRKIMISCDHEDQDGDIEVIPLWKFLSI